MRGPRCGHRRTSGSGSTQPTIRWSTSDPSLGWGRDYAVVPPLRGIIYTDSESGVIDVAVDVAPLEGAYGCEELVKRFEVAARGASVVGR